MEILDYSYDYPELFVILYGDCEYLNVHDQDRGTVARGMSVKDNEIKVVFFDHVKGDASLITDTICVDYTDREGNILKTKIYRGLVSKRIHIVDNRIWAITYGFNSVSETFTNKTE